MIKTNSTILAIRLQDVFKTSSRHVAKTSLKLLQDVFKTSCKNVFKTSSRLIQDFLKTSSRRAKITSRRFQDVTPSYTVLFNTFSKLLWDIFKTFLRRTAEAVIYKRICPGHTSEKFMVNVQNLQESHKFLKFKFFTLLYLLVAACRFVFITRSNITMESFFQKYLTVFLSC